jgi:hypothetical protein
VWACTASGGVEGAYSAVKSCAVCMVRFGNHVSVCTHIVAGCAAVRLVVGSIRVRLVMAVSARR